MSRRAAPGSRQRERGRRIEPRLLSLPRGDETRTKHHRKPHSARRARSMTSIRVHRRDIHFLPDSSRVLIRPFIPLDSHRITKVLSRALSLSEDETEEDLGKVMSEFSGRHADIERMLQAHFVKVSRHLPTSRILSKARQLFIGSLFVGEYALESAALFNPSIVPHPDQSGLSQGALRVVISLRATGEGHISSIEFRSGVVS